MTKYVLFDVDGVLLDYTQGLERFIKHHYPHVGHPDHLDEHVFELTGRYGISAAEANQLLWDFHQHESFAHMEPLPGAVKAVENLHKFHPLVCITACGSNAETQKLRHANLHRVFGDVFEAVYCTDTFAEKQQYLQAYEPGFWIEDHVKNAQLGLAAGHQCYLVDAPYNQEDIRGIFRVKGCLEAAILILEQEA